MQAVWHHRPRSFLAPQPLAAGSTGPWHYLASAPLPPGLHGPARRPPLADILADIDTALGSLPRSSETPAHWRPMHGDFAPWNLRTLAGGGLALIDWEAAGWGPPGADRVFYEATSAALAAGDQLCATCTRPSISGDSGWSRGPELRVMIGWPGGFTRLCDR